MSDNIDQPRQTLDEVLASTGGPNRPPNTPEGNDDPVRLEPLGLDRPVGELASGDVSSQQGAGSSSYLTPGAQGGSGSPVRG